MKIIDRHQTVARTLRIRRATIVVVLAAVSAFFVACSSGDPKSQRAQAAGPPRAVSVAVAPVQKQDVPVYLSGLGSVTAFNTANIKSRIDGQIMKVNFREGQDVREGDLLIQIDSRPYEVQLEQMQAQLFRDQAQLRDAKLNLDRYVSLIPSGSIAQQKVDTQRALADQLEGTVRNDQAQIDSAKLNIVYCHITAPFNGRVGLKQVDPGNIVHDENGHQRAGGGCDRDGGHDDYDGCPAWRIAAGIRNWNGRRIAQTSWHHDRWRIAAQPVIDSLHDSGCVPMV